jgi:hypothetical protein
VHAIDTPHTHTHTHHTHTQAQHRRILQQEAEVEALRVDAGRQQEALAQQRAHTRAAEAQIAELQQELDNNAGACLGVVRGVCVCVCVFNMRYKELPAASCCC